jgi:hypothetical protein
MTQHHAGTPGFTLHERDKNETIGGFVRRIWRICNPSLPDDLSTVPLPIGHVIVPQGVDSPYRFGLMLRAQVGDDNATIWSCGSRYYACSEISYADDPLRAAVYDPRTDLSTKDGKE